MTGLCGSYLICHRIYLPNLYLSCRCYKGFSSLKHCQYSYFPKWGTIVQKNCLNINKLFNHSCCKQNKNTIRVLIWVLGRSGISNGSKWNANYLCVSRSANNCFGILLWHYHSITFNILVLKITPSRSLKDRSDFKT